MQKVDSFGLNTEFKWSPSEVPLNLVVGDTRTILEDTDGNWIIAGQYYDERPCQNCYQHIPYIFSATQDFDSLIWQTRFYDLPNQNQTQYLLHSMTKVDDGFVVAADHLASDESPFPPSGVLFKASLDGDSLWMKHYIPLNWDEERVAWVNFNDVKTTPNGDLIVAGTLGDIELQTIRPWILHLDSNGCLVPGCNIVNTNEEVWGTKNKKFSIYPNPASEELYLLSSITSTEVLDLEIITNEGVVLRSTAITPQSSNQYILPLSQLTPGVYHLLIKCGKKSVIESHSFIKQ
ncbi:MAG: T9SS type A sorting domain-containing protein [Saprospiraceae bacterium]|nr:T9SS type A sorting domain-containing protein [Candidatus Opimibacter skivensis]